MGHSVELLNRFDWGCKAGEHIGWVVVEAQDDRTARMLLPAAVRERARVVGLNKFSLVDVQGFHAEST
jgi:hypothetical protein